MQIYNPPSLSWRFLLAGSLKSQGNLIGLDNETFLMPTYIPCVYKRLYLVLHQYQKIYCQSIKIIENKCFKWCQILNQVIYSLCYKFKLIILALSLEMLQLRQQDLHEEKSRSLQDQSIIFKYMLGKQQIQQMSLLDEENGTSIFYKLKGLFFDDNQEEQHIINAIRQDPIKIVGNMLYELTKSYNDKLNQILQPLEQDKYHLLQKLRQTRQQLQHSMDDNQFFKATIDRLEEEKKQTEEKLNQSIDQFERSREQIIYEIHQREKIRSEVMKIYVDAQEIYTQNSQLKQRIAEQEKKLMAIQEQNCKLRLQNEDVLTCNQDLTSKYNEIYKNRSILLEEIEDLHGKLHERQLFIASFIDQYNKVHLFNQHESLSPQETFFNRNYDEQNPNELHGLNFNNYDDNSNISQKSLSKDNSLRDLKSEMDEKFQFVTAQKMKPKIPINYLCVTEQKHNKKMESKVSSKQKNINSKNKYASNKVEIAKIQSGKKVNKTLVKTVSSKNFQHKQSVMISPSQGDESKMMQQMLKKKLVQKNQKIAKLDSEIACLKDSLIEQRQKITIMEGQYELLVEQLKEELTFTKRQLSKIYQNYTLINSQCQAYKQRIDEIQHEMQAMEEDHAAYCEQLKIRCKAYVLKRIDQIELQYESMKKTINNDSYQSARSQQHYRLQYSVPTQQELPEEFHLQFGETPPQNRQNSCKIDSFSEIQSYQRLSNHYLNGFDLEFSTKLSNIDQIQQEQIFIQQKFEIQSNLGMFTQRLIVEKYGIDSMKRGNLTDRCNNFNLQIDQNLTNKQRQKILTIIGQVYQQMFQFTLNKDSLSFSKQVEYFYFPKQLKLHIQSNIFQLTRPQKQPVSLDIFQSHEISLQTKKTRFLQLASQIININVQTQSNNNKLKYQAVNFIHIDKQIPKMSLISAKVMFNHQKIKKFKQQSSQTNIQEKSQSFTQINLDLSSCETQTKFLCPDSYCQTQIFCNEAYVQTSLLRNHQSTQVYFQYSTSQTQTIITNFVLSSKIINESYTPIIKISSKNQLYPLQFMHIQSELSKDRPSLQIVRQIEIAQTYHSQIGYQDNAFQLIKIPSFNAQADQYLISSKSPMSNSSKPYSSTVCTSEGYTVDKNFRNFENNQSLIHENTLYEIQDRSYDKDYNSEESICDTSVLNKSIKNIQENLSTKNDECLLSKIESELVSKYLKLETVSNQLSSEEKLSDKKSQGTPHFTEQIIALGQDSVLNNAILLSESCLKDDGKTYNPQSKSYKTQRINPSQITISPWFVEDFKDREQVQSQKRLLPNQVVYRLTKETQCNLLKHLNKHKLSLTFDQQISHQNFKKPRHLKKKIHFIFVKNDRESEIFMITSNRIHNLKSNLYIKCDKNYRIDDGNFMFGQSQVVITGDGRLIINRKDKLNKLYGKLQDGIWQIERYITCSYHTL